MEPKIEDMTFPEIICALLRDAGVIPFMPEVWREDCGAVFLTGEIKREALCESVGFEPAVRCGETAEERNEAIKCLSRISEFFGTCDAEHGGVRGYIVPTGGVRCVRTEKSGMAEYRAEYTFIRERVDRDAPYRYYINTGSRDNPVWSAALEGFFRFDEKTSAEVFERRYFHEDESRADISGYSTEISYEVIHDSDAPAAVKLCGEEGTVEVLAVSAREDAAFPGVMCAVLREYTHLPPIASRDRGLLTSVGKLMARGEGKEGRFVLSTGIFTVEN